MSIGMMGRKVGMTQVFSSEGLAVPVTVVSVESSQVLGVREYSRHSSLVLGFEESGKKASRAEIGHFKKIGELAGTTVTPKRHVKELRMKDDFTQKTGDILSIDLFEENEKVAITGTSKGKGTQGVVKRHGMSGGRATHGSHFHRRVGSIGANTFPSRVWKGKKMGGRMGNEQVTVRNLLIYRVDKENRLLYIKGAIPGGKRGLLFIRKQG